MGAKNQIFELHYAKLELEGDIPQYKCRTKAEVRRIAKELMNDRKDIFDETRKLWFTQICVFLVSINDEVFVTERKSLVIDLIEMYIKKVIHIQEYESFEDAYDVALDMKEGSTSLCYKPEIISTSNHLLN